MADVSVEFGAKDTGLEQTLKTVQNELNKLNAQVKSGELSFEELQKTMKQVAQAEKLQQQLQGMAQATSEAGNAAGTAAPKVDDIGKETKKAGKEAEDFGEKSKGGFLKMSGAVAAGQLAAEAAMAGIRAAINLAKGAIDDFGAALDLGGRLDDLSIQTGIAAGDLLVLERAFQNSGAGADKMSTTISKVASAIVDASNGSGTASAAFERLGLSAQELINLPADQQFEKIAAALTGVSNETERSALASDIFGERLAKDLLPLISDFSGEVNKANGQLGSLPDIMNDSAAAFAGIGDNIKVVQGKFTEFASGILSRVTPALEAITEGLSRIDAAAIGQRLADAFIGGQNAMKGFQAAVDAFKIGEFGKAFELIFESIKLQLMQTGNAIITNFTAAFKTVGDVMAEIFRPDGPTFMVVRSAFDFVASYAKEKIAGAMSEMFASMGPAFAGISESLKQHSDAGATAAELALQRIPIAASLAAEDIGNALAGSTQTFKDNLAESESTFFDIGEQSAKVKGLQDEITAAVAKTNEETKKTNELLTATPTHTDQIKKDFDQMMRDMNTTAAAVSSLPNGLSGSAEPARKLGESLGGAGTAATTLKQQIDEINQKELNINAEPFNQKLDRVRGDLQYLLGDLLGAKLENVSLEGLTEKFGILSNGLDDPKIKLEQLNRMVEALQNADPAEVQVIVDGMGSADSKIRQLGDLMREQFEGIDATPRIDREAVGEGVAATKDTIESALSEFKPKVTPEVNESQLDSIVQQIRSEIDQSLGEPINLDLQGDDGAQQAKNQVDSEFADPIALGLNPDIDLARSVVESGFADPVPMELNAERSIGEIKEQLKEEIDLSLSSSKGTEHLTNIDKVVDAIKKLVEKIEEKLPLQALAY